jgi:hypothetical protein
MVEEGLSDEEELMLSWVSRWVPQRQIAEWLGIGDEALAKIGGRVMRRNLPPGVPRELGPIRTIERNP